MVFESRRDWLGRWGDNDDDTVIPRTAEGSNPASATRPLLHLRLAQRHLSQHSIFFRALLKSLLNKGYASAFTPELKKPRIMHTLSLIHI